MEVIGKLLLSRVEAWFESPEGQAALQALANRLITKLLDSLTAAAQAHAAGVTTK